MECGRASQPPRCAIGVVCLAAGIPTNQPASAQPGDGLLRILTYSHEQKSLSRAETKWSPPRRSQQRPPCPATITAMLFLTRLARGLAALATLGTTVVRAAYPDPGACSGDCWTHDPVVVKRADGTYFRFSTGGGMGIYKATDLTGSWTYEGVVLTSGSSISITGNTGSDAWVGWSPVFLFLEGSLGGWL